MATKTYVCYRCGKVGALAEDETGPGPDEMAVDMRGLVRLAEHVCGECLDAAEDEADRERAVDEAIAAEDERLADLDR